MGVHGLLIWGASAADGGMRVQLMRCACASATRVYNVSVL